MFEGPDVDSEVVLVGRSNVGKTTLMREITGKQYDTGRRPGVTLEPNSYDWSAESFAVTDLPGFGFMNGVEESRREKIKDGVVEYVESNSDRILVAVEVVDGNSFVEIVDRWTERGEVPHDVDMFRFLTDLGIPTVVAVNKTDKIDDRDSELDEIGERLGLLPPWDQWDDTIAPISAKRGNIEALNSAVGEKLRHQNRHDLLKFF
ncbi:GTP-binding protein EngB [Halorutilales archaeon Cl-col2-1]